MTDYTELDTEGLLIRVSRYKEALKMAEDAVKAAQELLVQRMKEEGRWTVSAQDGYEKITGTLVEATRIVIDEPRLKKKVGAAMWDKITKKALDKEKLAAAIVVGDVDPNVVAEVSEEVPNSPYVRVARKAAKSARKVKKP